MKLAARSWKPIGFKREFITLLSNLMRLSEDRVDHAFKQPAPPASILIQGQTG
jgi:hypothetical protein